MSDFRTLDRIATSQHGVLTFEQLEKSGLTKHQIRHRVESGQLRRRAHRVYIVAGAPPSWEQEASAAALATRPFGALSLRGACRQWEFRTVDDEIDVSILYPRRLTIPGVTVIRSRDLHRNDITWVNGIATTTPERTIGDMGLRFPEHEVQRVLDHAISTGLVNRRDMISLRWRISKQGRDGAGIVDRCLENLPDGAEETESSAEVLFLRMCELYDVPIPALQLPIVVAGRYFRVDFAYPSQKIFVEIDGRATHGELHQIADDGGRQNLLVADGWRPLRFMYEHLKDDPTWCASQILTFCEPKRGWRPHFGSQKHC